MNYAAKIKRTLIACIDEMAISPQLYVKNPNTNFSRTKKWSFSEMLKFTICMEGKSLKDELNEYFDYSKETPSNSSFNQRRAQILPETFEILFHKFMSSVPERDKTYKGYTLIACDGSDIGIALNRNDKTTYIQSHPTDKGFNQLHLNACYDLLNKIYVDAVIQPIHEENELRAMCDMVDRYKGRNKTIFIADRNYESYNNFAHVHEKGMYYLIRVKDIKSTGILSGITLPQTDEFDKWFSFILTSRQTNEIKADKERYKFLSSKVTFDYMNKDEKFYDIKFRIIRFPISKTAYECVITNLSEEEFNAEEIKKIYKMRWGIETSFRELKYAIGMTQFHAKKTDYIKQEIWARLLLYNFCEIITAHVVVKKEIIESTAIKLIILEQYEYVLTFCEIKKLAPI